MYNKMIGELNHELSQVKQVSQDEIYLYFSQYVDNMTRLKEMITLGFFRFEYSRVKSYMLDTIFEDGIHEIVSFFRTAMKDYLEECKPYLGKFSMDISKGSTNITKLRFLDTNKRPQRLDLFAKEVLRDIAETVENTLQPYIVMIYQIRRIVDKRDFDPRCKLGSIIRELTNDNLFHALYCDLVMGENIARWRNAYEHGSYSVSKDKIIVKFEDKEVVTDRKGLQTILIVIDWLVCMHKTAYMLFTVDYHDEIGSQNPFDILDNDSLQDMVVMHVAEVSSMYNCQLDLFEEAAHVIVISMLEESIPHETITHLIDIIVSVTRNEYDILICYNGRVHYSVKRKKNGYECLVFNGRPS